MRRTSSRIVVLLSAVGALTLAGAAGVAQGSPAPDPVHGIAKQQAKQRAEHHAKTRSGHVRRLDADGGGDDEGDPLEAADQANQYAYQRSAPALSVSAAALLSARRQAAALPRAAGRVSEVTNQPYQAEPKGYTDPNWSNDGAGFGIVAGRMTSLAVDGSTYYAGAADGGVWKSTDRGTT